MDINIPGLKPIWIISFTNTLDTPNIKHHFQYCSARQILPLAHQCAKEAKKVQEELVNLKEVVDQFRDFLKKFKKEI